MAQFRLLSLSHQHAGITIREKFALNNGEIIELLDICIELPSLEEILILSTCNRTEIIYVSNADKSKELLGELCALKNQPLELATDHFKCYQDEKKVLEYLFRVSAGLESQILGDAQIISQFKSTYQLAQKQQSIGSYIHRFMQVILGANKKIASQTAFRSGISSAPYAAVDMIEEYSNMLKSPKIAVIGFGDMGQNVCRHLFSKGISDLTVLNRSQEKVALFNQTNKIKLNYRSLDHIGQALEEFDIIISTPSIQDPLIKKTHFKNSKNTFKVLVDISIPRSIEPDITQIPGVMLFDMDDIGKVTQETINRKKASKAAVENILGEHVQEFITWKENNKNLEIIRSMKSALETIKAEEMGRYHKEITEDNEPEYDKIMDAMIQKIIKRTVLTMKSLKDDQERQLYNSMITQTFL